MAMLKIHKGDTVQVIAGKDRGKRGRVLRIDRERRRAVVEGVNMIKRHTRPNPSRRVQGGIVEREAAIDMSNLMVISPDSGTRTRVGFKTLENGRKVRYAKVDGAILDR
jgi:large subunit ribosomal protein L24